MGHGALFGGYFLPQALSVLLKCLSDCGHTWTLAELVMDELKSPMPTLTSGRMKLPLSSRVSPRKPPMVLYCTLHEEGLKSSCSFLGNI